MVELQIGCALIVALYLVLRLRHEPRRAAFMGRFAALMAASWVAENTCIHAYGFYAYQSDWFLFIDQVPLLIIAIWPVVIHSALDLAAHRKGRTLAATACIGGLIVLTDAALIEPIAVHAGLWHWTEPGIFAVPIIGIIGWAIFGATAMAVLHSRLHSGWLLLIGPAITHAALLALWWGLLRHIHGPIDDWVAVAVAGGVAMGVVAWHIRNREAPRPPLATVMLRAPGAGFFFVLLAIHGRDEPALLAWTAAFAVPWLVYVGFASRRSTRIF